MRVRDSRGNSLVEFAPAFGIFIVVAFFLVGLAFYLGGVSTANFAAQHAAREAGSAGTRREARDRAIERLRDINRNPFGAFANISARGGGDISGGARIVFRELRAEGDGAPDEEVTATVGDLGGQFNSLEPETKSYQVRVELNYELRPPFIPGAVPGTAAAECFSDHPEGLNIVN